MRECWQLHLQHKLIALPSLCFLQATLLTLGTKMRYSHSEEGPNGSTQEHEGAQAWTANAELTSPTCEAFAAKIVASSFIEDHVCSPPEPGTAGSY